MQIRRLLLWLLTLVWVLLPASHVLAGDDFEQQAARHFDRGVELVEQGSFEQAVTEFTRAYELNPSASVLWKLAQAYVALDRPLEALEILEQYDRDGGEQIDAERRAELDRSLAKVRERVGRLSIVVQPAGASVTVDGESMGHAPLASELRLLPGEHQVTARLEGYGERSASVTVSGGKRVTLELLLKPVDATSSGAGQLAVRCAVPGVRVGVNGKPIGQTPFFGPLGVPTGEHQISFSRPGYDMASKGVEVSGGEVATVSCDARLAQPMADDIAGTVVLTVSERDVKVEVDGQPWPDDGRLPAGPHVLTARETGYPPVKVDFSLKAGEEKELHIGLASLRGEQAGVAVDEGPSSARVLAYVSGALGIAAGGVAFGLALWNDGRFDDWRAEQDAIEQPHGGGESYADLVARQNANDELADDIKTIDGLTIGLGIAGGALLATGIILFLASGDSEPQQGSLVIGPQPGGGYLGWAARW